MKYRGDSCNVSDVIRAGGSHVGDFQEQPFEVVWGDLIEKHLDVERRWCGLLLQREVPDRSTENQIKRLVSLEQLGCDIQNVLVAA